VTLQYVHPNQFIRRFVIKACIHTVEDVAVVAVQTLSHKDTGAPLRNKVLGLTSRLPKWAISSRLGLSQNPRTSTSAIVATCQSLRRCTMVKCGRSIPAVETEFCYPADVTRPPWRLSGASGGPVFDEHGHVFAVNSTGIDGTNIGYVSLIQSVGGLALANVMTSDGQLHERGGRLG
jgi:hypothetical protein